VEGCRCCVHGELENGGNVRSNWVGDELCGKRAMAAVFFAALGVNEEEQRDVRPRLCSGEGGESGGAHVRACLWYPRGGATLIGEGGGASGRRAVV